LVPDQYYDKGILELIREIIWRSICLLRPVVEAQVRAPVVLMGSNEDVARIKNDTYTVNFRTVGAEIDERFI
jgi:hypothetical protein